ncbi:RNA polymerase sigma factor [Mongoliibacter ruber]|uniref:RNA polymerase sigma-70 factor (ECF subfamily) n=1 Tax=Mongoliibacter ruber TaxID=1750599 RepID=A0A2T0WHY3_9BACT|nr:RNA polymerase sigma factor [Mongoliibacter ruber]PRY86307.1 RNA polymerase sigma-70 factor (ECF subfamily) [Mongoliibacter ruber]
MVEKRTIEKAVNGNQKAERLLYDALCKPLFMLCLRYLKHQEDAEDVLSSALIKVFGSLHKFEYEGDGSLEAWSRKITVNECLMCLRKQKRSPMMVEPDENISIVDEGILDKLSADELFELILQLPEGYRTVFNLYEIEGYTHAEISKNLGISLGTSKSQLSKARNYLKKLVTANGWNNASKII